MALTPMGDLRNKAKYYEAQERMRLQSLQQRAKDERARRPQTCACGYAWGTVEPMWRKAKVEGDRRGVIFCPQCLPPEDRSLFISGGYIDASVFRAWDEDGPTEFTAVKAWVDLTDLPRQS